ncbi:TonB-dependent receptor [Hymenobacter sp. RP-2-7]|uniref:TonB-dependent receptor n=1 Tax=Hymenobacter polaris TaxID=2682546 RepID=A0A7Y0ADW3_9BACT|nr:carboxypeptidase-like regulatory domain-containing protein [Hymenobacter polaris]NML65300.1 TonB-dependent receptor [Hymenobacter polaris]
MSLFYRTALVLLLAGSLASYGQQAAPTPTLTGTFQGVPFAEFARQVAATTPYRLAYDPAQTDSLRVTLTATGQPLAAVLQQVLAPAKLHFSVDEASRRVYITAGEAVQTRLPDDFFRAPAPAPAASASPGPVLAEAAGPARAPAGRVYDIGLGQAAANGRATLSGRVRDARGESVVGALVYGDVPTNGVSTDQFGAYTLTLPVGRQRLNVRSLGFKNTTRQLNLLGNGRLDVELEEDITPLKEVVVEGEKAKNVTSLRMGVAKLDIKDIKQIPTVFGEADVLRVVLLLPGVKSIGEGNTGFSVRGGGADQNLVLYNDAVIYNPTHLFGFFSAFNTDMLKSAELYKSTVPARYGGRLSSVLDVVTRDGNRKQFSATGGLGLLTSRLTLEGPLAGGRGSWLVGGRTSYSNWLLKQLPSRTLQNSAAGFYDLSGHLAYDLNERNSLYATGYFSHDQFRLASDTVYTYSNTAASLKWKHTLSSQLYGVLTGTFSRYQYGLRSDRTATTASELAYNLNQGGVQLDFTRFAGSQHTLEFGGSSLLYHIAPGQLTPLGAASLVVGTTIQPEQALESALYVADRFDLSARLALDVGLRYSLYNALGPRSVLTYQPGLSRSENTVTGTDSYRPGQLLATYQGPEWRFSAKYMLNDVSSVKASYNRTRQYIHQLTNTTVVSPTDNWKLSDNYIQPQVADQVSLGYYHNFRSNSLEFSVETYYKLLHNFLDYKDGAVLLLNPHLETDVVNARGRAYGAEFLLRKTTGKLNGWLSYTYARSLVQVNTATDQVNDGNWYPSNYDKPHDVTLVGNYRFNRRISASLNFNYSTGRPITLPLSQYYLHNVLRVFYSERNAYRVPDYYRVDLAFNLEGNHKIKKLAHGSWTLAIYNLLGRRNPYSIYFQAQQGQINGYQLSIFGQPIPTVTYNFRF